MPTITLRPNGPGTHTNITIQYPSSDYHWDKVDESTADEDSTYVAESTTSPGKRDTYSLENTDITEGIINSISVYIRCRRWVGTYYYNEVREVIRTGGNTYYGTIHAAIYDYYYTYSKTWTTNPYTGNAWTWNEINNLEAGVALIGYDASHLVYCTQVYVVVDYSTVVIPTVTTQACTSVTATGCTGNGNITNSGGENCTRRGFCYMLGNSGDPTTANSTAYDDGSFGTGAYTKAISGLSADSVYRVRAYAVNSAGTGYGSTRSLGTNRSINLLLGLISTTIEHIESWKRKIFSKIGVNAFTIEHIENWKRKFSTLFSLVTKYSKGFRDLFISNIALSISSISLFVGPRFRKFIANVSLFPEKARQIIASRFLFTNEGITAIVEKLKNLALADISISIALTVSQISKSVNFLRRIYVSINLLLIDFNDLRSFYRKINSNIGLTNRKFYGALRNLFSYIKLLVYQKRYFNSIRSFISSIASISTISMIAYLNRVFDSMIGIVPNIARRIFILKNLYTFQIICTISEDIYQYTKEFFATIGLISKKLKSISTYFTAKIGILSIISRFFDNAGKRKISFIRSHKNIDVYREEEKDYS